MRIMKYLIGVIATVCSLAVNGQSDDTTFYTKYPGIYGLQYPRLMTTKVLRPPVDTIYTKTGLAIKGGVLYVGNGSYWSAVSGGSGTVDVDSLFYASSVRIDTFKYRKNSVDYSWYVLDRQAGLIEPGVVTHDSLLVFSVSPAIYYIDGVRYTSAQTSLTLSAADPTLPRKDIIALDATGVIVIEGTPDANPAQPQVLPDQILLTVIDIAAGATTPSAVSSTIIYDENDTWTLSSSGLTANGDNASNVFHLSKATDVGAFSAGQLLTYTNGSDIDITDYTALKFHIRLKATFSNQARLQLTWMNNGLAVSSTISIANNDYGFSRTTVGSYMEIDIPISDWNFSSASIDALRIQMAGSNASGYYLDYIRIQSGINQPLPASGVTSVLSGYGIANTPNPIVGIGTVAVDSAVLAEYFLRRRDSVNAYGYATNYDVSQINQKFGHPSGDNSGAENRSYTTGSFYWQLYKNDSNYFKYDATSQRSLSHYSKSGTFFSNVTNKYNDGFYVNTDRTDVAGSGAIIAAINDQSYIELASPDGTTGLLNNYDGSIAYSLLAIDNPYIGYYNDKTYGVAIGKGVAVNNPKLRGVRVTPAWEVFIDSLTNLSSQDQLIGIVNSSGQLGQTTIGYGLDLTSGALKADTTEVGSKTFIYDAIAASGGTPTLQQVFDTEIGGSVLSKPDTINTGSNYIRVITNSSSASINIENAGTGNGIYINNTNTSGFGGGIYAQTAGGVPVTGYMSVSSTNARQAASAFTAISTGTPTTGFGVGSIYAAKYNASSSSNIGEFYWAWSDAPNRSSYYRLIGDSVNTTYTYADFQPTDIIRVNNLRDTLATKAYARSVGGSGSGTVTNFSFTDANGFVGSVADPTTTPALTLNIGNPSFEPWYKYYFDVSNTNANMNGPSATGTGAAVSRLYTSFDNWHGGIQYATGTTTTGGVLQHFGNAGGVMQINFNTSYRYNYGIKVRLEDLSDGTETYKYWTGFADDHSTEASIVDGAWFSYTDGESSGQWECNTSSNSTRTTVASGITVAADTDYELEISVIGGSAYFYINKTLVVTTATNVPSGTTRATSINNSVRKSAGTTSRNIYWEWQAHGKRSN